MTKQSPGESVVSKLAASVILLRESPDGPMLFVQQRASTMDFAAGMVVFPGGRVDARDASGWNFAPELLSRHAAAWRHCSIAGPENASKHAGTLLAAAQREVLEECGIILDPSSLVPWANWVTPEGQPKRFDTYFYLAIVPAGMEPLHQTTEATASQWMTARDIVDAENRGSLRLLPPTLTLIDELLGSPLSPDPHKLCRTIDPVRPKPGDMEKFFRLRRLRQGTDSTRTIAELTDAQRTRVDDRRV